MTMIKTIEDGVIDIVYSPDDGGYYLQKYKFSTKEDWVSKRIYAVLGSKRTYLIFRDSNHGKTPEWELLNFIIWKGAFSLASLSLQG